MAGKDDAHRRSVTVSAAYGIFFAPPICRRPFPRDSTCQPTIGALRQYHGTATASRQERSDCNAAWRRIDDVDHVAGIDHAGGLEAQHLGFVVGTGAVLDATRHDDAITRPKLKGPVAELDAKAPLPDQKK